MHQTTDTIDLDKAPSIPALFDERVNRSPDAVAYRQFEPSTAGWQSYCWRDIDGLVGRWRAGFKAAGLRPGDRVAILLKNSVEWVCFDLAALSSGLVTVPLHVTDGPHNWADRLADAEPKLLLIAEVAAWQALAALPHSLPALEQIVCIEPVPRTAKDMVHLDAWLPQEAVPVTQPVRGEDLATITYTSGTTGRPKGVMLSHRNILFAADATLERNPGYLEDVFLSFLPMAHIFERTTEYYVAMMCGGQIAFARSIADLPEDFAAIRPTIVMGVPRIFEKIWKGIVTSAQDSPIGRWLIKRVVAMASDGGADGLKKRAQRALVRLFITRKLMKRFGGRVRLMVCGGAPLSPDLAKILRTIGLPLLEGYGLAEAAGPVSGDPLAEYEPGAVGRPLDGVDIRFAETGEILLRSDTVMSGYWKRPAETAEALDEEGWLHTGDVGELHNGRLRIHGRIRDLIVLSTGEKLAPSDIESQIITDPLFEQAVVLGDKRPIVVALVVLDNERWKEFAAMHGLDPKNPNTPAGREALRERIATSCQAFPRYAEVRRVHASLEPWTAEDGLVSVTLKVKRDAVSTRFQSEIEDLYVGHE
jgi:long-chain acyl-CoA synthetase